MTLRERRPEFGAEDAQDGRLHNLLNSGAAGVGVRSHRLSLPLVSRLPLRH